MGNDKYVFHHQIHHKYLENKLRNFTEASTLKFKKSYKIQVALLKVRDKEDCQYTESLSQLNIVHSPQVGAWSQVNGCEGAETARWQKGNRLPYNIKNEKKKTRTKLTKREKKTAKRVQP